jgi:hypothetical protein
LFVGGDFLSGYLLSIIGIVTFSAVLSVILPDGKTNKLIKGIAKICTLSVLLAPVLSFFRSGSEGDGEIKISTFSSQFVIETDTAFIDYCSMKRIGNAETQLEKELFEVFSVETQITLIWEYAAAETAGTEIKITKAVIGAEEEIDGELAAKMKTHIAENYGCEVEFV